MRHTTSKDQQWLIVNKLHVPEKSGKGQTKLRTNCFDFAALWQVKLIYNQWMSFFLSHMSHVFSYRSYPKEDDSMVHWTSLAFNCFKSLSNPPYLLEIQELYFNNRRIHIETTWKTTAEYQQTSTIWTAIWTQGPTRKAMLKWKQTDRPSESLKGKPSHKAALPGRNRPVPTLCTSQ